MDLKMRPSSAAKCFGGASHTATGGQWMTWICGSFLVFICFLIVSFPFHRAPILSINKNLTLMRERGFDFHFPLWVLHIFFIFLFSLSSVCGECVIPSLVPHTGQEGSGEMCLYNSCVYTTFKVRTSFQEKNIRGLANSLMAICGAHKSS